MVIELLLSAAGDLDAAKQDKIRQLVEKWKAEYEEAFDNIQWTAAPGGTIDVA